MKRLLLLLSVVGLWQFSSAQCPPASPLTTPYYENFDSQASGQTGVFANCWTATTTADPNWETDGGGTTSGGTGPSDDFTGGGIYVYMETSGGSLGDTSGLISPPIDLTPLTTPELTFYYHMYGVAMGSLDVQIWDGTSWSTELTIVGQQQTSDTDPWLKGIIGLASYSGTIQIKFLGTDGNSFTSDMAIDEVRVEEAPACPQPTGITISNVAATSADASWNSVAAAANGYEVIYGAVGFNPATGGTSATTATTSFSITGLAGATEYDVYIISDCAANGISDTSGPVSFTTLCLPFTQGYGTNFDSDALDLPPLCWDAYVTNPSAFVEVEDFTGTSAPRSAPQALYIYNFNAGAADTTMAIGPQFSDLTAGDKQVNFWANSDDPVTQLIVGTVADQMSPETFVPLDTITFPTPDTYQQVLVSVTAANGYNGTHQYVAFLHNHGGTFDYIRIDDFVYQNIPNCPLPTSLVNSNLTDVSVDAAWTENGTATSWQLSLGASGFTAGSGIQVVTSNNPYSVAGLTPNTTYDWYVRAICAPGDTSPWSGVQTFTTFPSPPPLPTPLNCTVGNPSVIFSEEFDAGANGWTGDINAGNGSWEIPGGPTSGNTGPNFEHSGAAGSFMSYEASSTTANQGSIVSPAIDLSAGAGDAELSFWMHAYGASIGTLTVGVGNSATGPFTSVFTWTGQFQTSGNDPWVNVGADLTPYLGQTIYLEFFQVDAIGVGSGFDGDIAIDLVEVSTCLSCANPSMLTTSNVLATSADLAWMENGTATEWELSYGAAGFTPGAGTQLITTTNPTSLTGLMPASNYEWYVRAICGPGDTSGYVGVGAFQTPCVAFTAPYNQNFDALPLVSPFTDLPICWEPQTGPDFWDVTDDVTNTGHTWLPNIGDHTTGTSNYMWIDASGDITPNEMVSPLIDVSGLNNPLVGFWFASNNTTNTINHTISLDAWDGAAWVNITSLSGNFPGWVEVSGTLPAGVPTTTKFRIQAIADPLGTGATYFYNDLGVDDFFVIEAPSCFAPSMVGVESTDDQSATVYWTTGGATNWNIEYGPAGFTPGAGTLINPTNDTTVITGLMPATAYEFYVRDSCAPGDVSIWVGPTAFSTTPCAATATCTYTAELFDSFGDGWNGAQATIWQAGVPVATLGAGFTGGNNFTESFDVCDGLMTFVTLSNAGGFPNEVGVYIRDRAGDTVASYPNSGLTAQGDTLGMFTVDCSNCPVFTAPFMETFEANSPSLLCWSPEYVVDSADWTLGMGSSGGLITMAHTGTQNAVFVSQSGGPDITRGVSPVIDISALSAPELRFWYGQEVWFGDQNYLNVYYRTSDVAPWMLIFSDSTNQPAWIEGVVSLPTPSATYQVAFEGINNWGRANVLDDVSIMDAPACPAPSALGVTNVTATTADIYWTTGGATNWLVRYSDGTTDSIVASANDTITLTGLTAGTSYSVEVRDSCAAGDVSVWAGPINFNTNVCLPANSCNYSALLIDGFGDGWNGAEVTVYQNGIPVQVLGAGFTTGTSFGPVSVALCDGLSTHFVLTNGGGFPNEVGMDLNDPFSSFVASYAPSLATAQGDTLISIVSSCAAPACAPPSNLGATNIATTSADLYWTGVSGAMMYNVQYGPQGFTPGTGTIVTSANDTLNLTGINPSQCYDFWVQTDCGTDSSIYVGPFVFCTLCAPINTFPYTEGFVSAPVTQLPACYIDSTTAASGGPFTWTVDAGGTTSGSTGPATDASGSATGNYVYTEASSPAAAGDSAFLFLPEFDITSMTNPELVFAYHMYGANITTLDIEIFDMMSSSWVGVDSIVGQQQASSIDGWQERRIALGAYSSANLMIRFLHVRGSSFNGDAAIDDVTIREIPPCVDPTGLMVTGVGTSTIDLTWMSDTNVTASSVQYGPVGFSLGAGTTVGSMAGMASVSGLMMNTCYDFYVLDSCGGATNWVGPVTACTKPACTVTGVPTNVTGDTTGCGGGPATLSASATGGQRVGWSSAGTIVGTGSPYTTDTIGLTTTYEAFNFNPAGLSFVVGPAPSIAATGFGNFTNGQYISVLDTIVIDSMTVRANGFVSAQMIITDGQSTTDGGNIIQRGAVFTTDSNVTGNYQVAAGVVLVPGQYFMGIDFLPGTIGSLFRATAGAVYPYVLPGLMTIDSVNFAGPRYYYTYELVVQNACIGAGVPTLAVVPGANAGASDSVVVCETESAVDLGSFLGIYDFGGTWADDDASGALTDSLFDASQVAIGTYNFTYTVGASGGCTVSDSATITVTVEASPFAGNDTAASTCITGTPIQLRALLPGSTNGGTITDLDNSGGLVGTLLLPGNVTAAGTYRFQYVITGNACPADTSIITMSIDDVVDAGMDASDTIVDCTTPVDLTTYLSANATAGGTWVDVNATGGLTGSTFDPSVIANTALVDFRYVLTSGCGDDSSTVTLFVDCTIGLREYTTGNLDVYPNPTSGVVNIESLNSNNKIQSIEVYAINGELLVKRSANGSEVRIDLSGYADGLYNIKVMSEMGVELHRINKK